MELSHLSHFFKKYEQFVSRDVIIRDTLLPLLENIISISLPRESISVVRSVVSVRTHPAYQTLIRMHARELEQVVQDKLEEKKITIVC